MSNYDPTRVMTPGGDPSVGAPGATLQMPASGPDPFRTQMGGTVTCPICHAVTPLHELYCGECGFLLTSAPPEEEEVLLEDPPIAELVDATDGRRFRLRAGANTVGRQGSDILLGEPTVSRIHARIVVDGPSIVVEDMGSSNGTKVGDQRIAPNVPTPVLPGTPLRFGSWRSTVEVPVGAEATVVIPSEDAVGVGDARESRPYVPECPPVAALRRQKGPAGDILLAEGVVTVGRKTENSIALPVDAFVSGRHASIETDEAGSVLTDLGSTNGTLVNGIKLAPSVPQPLVEGDEVTLGQTVFVYTRSGLEDLADSSGVELNVETGDPAPVDDLSATPAEPES